MRNRSRENASKQLHKPFYPYTACAWSIRPCKNNPQSFSLVLQGLPKSVQSLTFYLELQSGPGPKSSTDRCAIPTSQLAHAELGQPEFGWRPDNQSQRSSQIPSEIRLDQPPARRQIVRQGHCSRVKMYHYIITHVEEHWGTIFGTRLTKLGGSSPKIGTRRNISLATL